jgi:hypothetical protein
LPVERFVGAVYDVLADEQWMRTMYAAIPLVFMHLTTMILFTKKRH